MLFNLLYNYFSGLTSMIVTPGPPTDPRLRKAGGICQPTNFYYENRQPTLSNGKWTCPSGYVFRPGPN